MPPGGSGGAGRDLMKLSRWIVAAGAALALAGCKEGAPEGGIDADRLVNAAADTANWITYGRDYSEQRYSPLDQIDAGNVGELGLAWFADLDTARGQEGTPLVIDGRIFKIGRATGRDRGDGA